MFAGEKKETTIHGIFLNDEFVMEQGKNLLNTFSEDFQQQLESGKEYITPEYQAFYACVPFVSIMGEDWDICSWEVHYTYHPTENDYRNGVFIDSKGKTDEELVSWIEYYLGDDLPGNDWKFYIADCDVERFVC